jgi:hypothetical protein
MLLSTVVIWRTCKISKVLVLKSLMMIQKMSKHVRIVKYTRKYCCDKYIYNIIVHLLVIIKNNEDGKSWVRWPKLYKRAVEPHKKKNKNNF